MNRELPVLPIFMEEPAEGSIQMAEAAVREHGRKANLIGG